MTVPAALTHLLAGDGCKPKQMRSVDPPDRPLSNISAYCLLLVLFHSSCATIRRRFLWAPPLFCCIRCWQRIRGRRVALFDCDQHIFRGRTSFHPLLQQTTNLKQRILLVYYFHCTVLLREPTTNLPTCSKFGLQNIDTSSVTSPSQR